VVRNRTNRLKSHGSPPYVINHEDKEVIFLIKSGMAYMGIETFLKNIGVPEYKGLVCKNKCQFELLKEKYE
tara:strand:- start:278 stop:490 length:213 start_codon:yes stop_codon:yes gene_type:complete